MTAYSRFGLVAVALVFLPSARAFAENDRPNIVFILADDKYESQHRFGINAGEIGKISQV